MSRALAYTSESYALLNRPYELDRHVRRVRRYLDPQPSDLVLEVGCGRGFLAQRIQRLAPATCGVDANPAALRHAVTTGLSVMDATRLAFGDASFDKVYSFHTIEHVPNLARALAEMERVLRPGGRLLLVYPAEPVRGLYAVPAALAAYGNPLEARSLHLHRLTPDALERLLRSSRLEHVESHLSLLLTPQWETLLTKRIG